MDTNVLVSAVIGHVKPRRLLRLVLRGHSAVASREMLAELADVLAREKFSLTPGRISRFLRIYLRKSEVVDLDRRVKAVDADPDDDIVLSTAVSGEAAFIVTGDKHLLELEGFEGVRIITVDAALKVLSAEKSE
ncbi:MAG: putative toxin-antitoxin system toxin component, PIN family [Thaumarchaeota archaeon]|nr:putative toxin-antitoxin system toxin component, PIN family [Nitrososphaerota archaeon]